MDTRYHDEKIKQASEALNNAYREKINYVLSMVALEKCQISKEDEIYKFDLNF